MSDPKVWQLHEAKARFSELFRRVRSHGPQRVVTQRGEAVVIVSAEEYDRSGELARQPEPLLEFFRSASDGGTLDLTRKRDTTRRIKVVTISSGYLPTIDAQLPATALHHGLAFVTRNTGDVRLTGVPLFNPRSG